MIFFITGLPRNGKTLFAVDYILQKSRAENRPVYYDHIKMLLVPENWFPMPDPENWYDLPVGSILFFDEAHHKFPNRSSTAKVPKIVEKLNEHGHRGFDIFFITQLPKFLDPTARGLAEQHWHVVRKFGGNTANIRKYYGTVDNPQSKQRKTEAFEVQSYSYNKKIYGLYHSSDQHNVVKKVPFKYKLLWFIPLLILALIVKVWFSWDSQIHPKDKPVDTQQKPVLDNLEKPQTIQAEQVSQGTYEVVSYQNVPFLERYKPQVDGVPESAIAYNDLTKPSVYPKPAVCVASKTRCQCYTQQTTVYHTTDQICRQIVKDGYFDNTPSQQTQYAQNDAPAAAEPASVERIPEIDPISVPPNTSGLLGSVSPLSKY
jgi:hypothetical protein